MSPFTFNTSQKKGILILILFILVLAIGKWVIPHFSEKKQQAYTSPFPETDTLRMELKPFDINQADSAQWASLPGIGAVLSKRILSYRRARKGFQSKEDLKKVYGLKPEVYEKILPYLLVDSLAKTSSPTFSQKKKYNRAPISPVDINLADSSAFDQLPGIGPVLSARIIKFRDAKKGFDSVEELKSVYGLKPEVYAELLPYLRITVSDKKATTPIPKLKSEPVIIDINTADMEQWLQLPGIGKVMAPRIIKFRKLLGHFAEADQLLLVYGMSEENFEKAKPFLKVGDLTLYPQRDLNAAEWKHLVKFPFITKKLANDILKERKGKGGFSTWQEVEYVRGMKPEVVRQMKFYFELK